MTKPVYHHPKAVLSAEDKRIPEENKRLWLKLTIDEKCNESIVVILKNPSRATKDISDKTVFNVTSYILEKKKTSPVLQNTGTICILNCIPFYETYSENLRNISEGLIDKENLAVIDEITRTNKKVITAWGNSPAGVSREFTQLTDTVMGILKKNKAELYYVDRLSKQGNPKHGMVWSYKDELVRWEI